MVYVTLCKSHGPWYAHLLETIIMGHDGNQNVDDELRQNYGLNAMFYFDRKLNFSQIVSPMKDPTSPQIIEAMPF